MRVFTISPALDADLIYAPSLAEAHLAAKSFPKENWKAVWINEIDLPTDKPTLIAALNRSVTLPEPTASWTLTMRGGLQKQE